MKKKREVKNKSEKKKENVKTKKRNALWITVASTMHLGVGKQ